MSETADSEGSDSGLHQAPKEDLQAISLLPPSLGTLMTAGSQIWTRISWAAGERLSAADREALRTIEQQGSHSDLLPETTRRCFNAVDEAICEYAGIIGARIFLSPPVYERVAQWEAEPNGPELYEKLGKMLALRVRVSRGQAKAPIDPRLKQARPEFIREVKMLRNLLTAKLPNRSPLDANRPLDANTIHSLAFGLIADRSQKLDNLLGNWSAIRGFIEGKTEGKERYSPLVELIMGSVTTAVFVDEFLGYTTNRSGEALRQAIAGLKDRPQTRFAR